MAPEQIRVYITVNLDRPDILEHPTVSYNPFKADIWSFGVCLFRMLCYGYPFKFEKKRQSETFVETLPPILKAMKKGFKIPEKMRTNLSDDCLNLMMALMEYNKNRRIHMNVVITDKWIINSPNLDKY